MQASSPFPIGAVGEIYIGGDGVAQGYLNQPERTASAFIKAELISDSSLPFPSRTLYKNWGLSLLSRGWQFSVVGALRSPG